MLSTPNFQFCEIDTSIHYTTRFLLPSRLRKIGDSQCSDEVQIPTWDDFYSPPHYKLVEILSNFFENEKVEEIQKIQGANITNYELRIVWKSLMIQLNVNVNSLGVANF